VATPRYLRSIFGSVTQRLGAGDDLTVAEQPKPLRLGRWACPRWYDDTQDSRSSERVVGPESVEWQPAGDLPNLEVREASFENVASQTSSSRVVGYF